MRKPLRILLGITFLTVGASAQTNSGYRGDGSCVSLTGKPPITWDDKTGQNILWKAPMPNWGGATPVVAGGRVYTVSEPGWKSDWAVLVCHDAVTGKELWTRELNHLDVAVPDAAKRAAVAKEVASLHAFYREFYRAVFLWNTGETASARQLLAPLGLTLSSDFVKAWNQYAIGSIRKNGDNPATLQRLAQRWHELTKSIGYAPETWRHGVMLGGGVMCVGHGYATPVSDGQRVWVATGYGAFACYDRDGKQIWMKFHPGNAGEFCRNGRSPVLYKDLLLSDITAKARAIDKNTGELKWARDVDSDTVMTPALITTGGTDVLLCFNKKAFRLPDGKPLKVETANDFGHLTFTKHDERDVTFSFGVGEHCGWTGKGTSDTPSPAAVRWTLNGDTLAGKVLWSGIEGKPVGPHASVYHAGKLYTGGVIVDALTGKMLAGKANARRGEGATPVSQHLLWIANRHLYGMQYDGSFAVYDLNGKPLSKSALLPAPVEGEKREQLITQDSPRIRDSKAPAWNTLSYSAAFVVSGDRIYARTADYLYCIGAK